MKKLICLFSLLFMVLFFVSCNSPANQGGITKDQLEQPPTEETNGPVR